MTAARIAAIKARVEKATAAPWSFKHGRFGTKLFDADFKAALATFMHPDCGEFAAHARDDIPYLLAELSAKEARIAELEARLSVRHTGAPDYCPDGLREDEICPDCGASAENLLACNARFNGRRPRSLVELTVVRRSSTQPADGGA